MKAAFLTGIEKIEIRDTPRPTLQKPGHVLIQIKAVGICGSDIHYYTRGGIGEQRVIYPFCIGHECAGEIIEVGPKVSRYKPGELVVIDPAVSCGTCRQCKQGRFNTCENLLFLGCPGQMPGALCEYLSMPVSSCYKIPPTLSPVRAVLAEPLSIALHALSFLRNPSDTAVAVLGCGPIGLSVILAAKHMGVGSIYATDKIDSRVKAATLIGITAAGNPDREDIIEKFRAGKPGGFDAVIECCGQQEALDQAIRLLTPGGQLIIVGIPEIDRINFDPHLLRRKEISIHNVRRQNNCIARAVELLAGKGDDFDFMITHRYNLDKIKAAFQLVKNYDDGVIKAIILVG
jgi:L-iditol 2-dehydrogenase